MHMYIHTNMHMYTHINMHMYIHTNMHMYLISFDLSHGNQGHHSVNEHDRGLLLALQVLHTYTREHIHIQTYHYTET
jgi:hypothetical protein